MTTDSNGNYLPPFPFVHPFPESTRNTTGRGADFPGAGGDREHGKFRPAAEPRLTRVAVALEDSFGNDSMASAFLELTSVMNELLREVKALRLGLVMAENNVCDDVDPDAGPDDSDAWL